MNRKILTSALAAFALLIGAAFAVAQQFGTAAEAKAMLDKAVAALKANEADALAKFNSPTGGFRDRDLYVFCFDMTTGKFNAHVNPALMGTDARALKVNGQPVGANGLRRGEGRHRHDGGLRLPEARNDAAGSQGILRHASWQRGLRRRLLQIKSIKAVRNKQAPDCRIPPSGADHYSTIRLLCGRHCR